MSTSSLEISNFIQNRLRAEKLDEVAAVEAAKWLDRAGLLADSPDRPGRELRRLLRNGEIAGAVQRPSGRNGRWFIVQGCPFCRRAQEENADGLATSFPDAFPSAPGHRLVIPARHVSRIEELSGEEWTALFDLVRDISGEVMAAAGVDGCNIGLNNGETAGQTVAHVHVHVIPRREGDVGDPRGGIRWVLPETADYWSGRSR